MKRILFIGNMGYKSSSLDGQTIKTRMIYDYLKQHTNLCIVLLNTERRNVFQKICLFVRSIFSFLFYKKIFIIVARNGLKFYLPLVGFFKKIRKIEVYNSGIGARHDEFIRRNQKYVKFFNSCKFNMFETKGECEKMLALGVTNCVKVGNFKNLTPLMPSEVAVPKNKYLSFCTFSRLSEKKGIVDAVDAIRLYNKKNQIKIKLDLYGTIDDDFKEVFPMLHIEKDEFINYLGPVNPYMSVEVLRNYDALIFPTKHKTEGFPGTILDAYASALPIIGTNVCYNGEFIFDGKNGILYDNPSAESLLFALEKFISLKEHHLEMRYNSLKLYNEYDYDKIGMMIIDLIQK